MPTKGEKNLTFILNFSIKKEIGILKFVSKRGGSSDSVCSYVIIIYDFKPRRGGAAPFF